MKFIVLLFLLLGLSSCGPTYSIPLILSVEVTNSSDGDILAENSDSWVEIKVEGRNLTVPEEDQSLKICEAFSSSNCLTVSTISRSNTLYKARISGWSTSGIYNVNIKRGTSDYSADWSNTCKLKIY